MQFDDEEKSHCLKCFIYLENKERHQCRDCYLIFCYECLAKRYADKQKCQLCNSFY